MQRTLAGTKDQKRLCGTDPLPAAQGRLVTPPVGSAVRAVNRDYNQDQNSTRTVRAIRRVTRSRRRRSPQKIFPCPLMSGFNSRSAFSISVVTVAIRGFKLLRVAFA